MFNVAEKAFFARMASHAAKGLSFDAAANQVLADDQRLLKLATDKSAEARELRRAIAGAVFLNVNAQAMTARLELRA